MTRVVVYSRESCHLCEDLLADLGALAAERGFDVEVRDIDRDPALRAAYDTRVPVVTCDGKVVCEYYLDPAGLLARLGELR